MKAHSCRTKFCRPSTRLLVTLLGVLAVGGLLVGAQPAAAQGTCIQDVWKAHGNKQNLTCTAQDVTLSEATNIDIITGGTCDADGCRCTAGGTVTFTADFRMDLTADTRYDVGFYLATDGDPNGDGAVTGQCTATASLTTNTPAGNFINLDTGGDVCGDITGPLGTANNPLFVQTQISAPCPAGAGQQLLLPFCTTWRQPGSNEVCLGTGSSPSTNDAYPGSPSKCNCGILALDIFSEAPDITVAKSAAPTQVPETGGSVTYTVQVTNNGTVAVTLTSLVDDKYGNIAANHAAGANCDAQGNLGTCLAVSGTTCVPDASTATCQIGGSIAGGGSCSCTFNGAVPPGDTGGSFTDTVTACANNISSPTPICRTDPATVTYTDVPQPPTLTKTATSPQCRIDVNYNVTVSNTSAQDTLTLNTLSDNIFGNITSAAGTSCTGTCIPSTTCGVATPTGPGTLPAVIPASGNYSCSFVGRTSSCSQTVQDTVTGAAVDDDGASYTPSDGATVVISVTITQP